LNTVNIHARSVIWCNFKAKTTHPPRSKAPIQKVALTFSDVVRGASISASSVAASASAIELVRAELPFPGFGPVESSRRACTVPTKMLLNRVRAVSRAGGGIYLVWSSEREGMRPPIREILMRRSNRDDAGYYRSVVSLEECSSFGASLDWSRGL
jgi:hypothetical protein